MIKVKRLFGVGVALTTTMILLSGCGMKNIALTAANTTVEKVYASQASTLKFMSVNNYNGSDISNIRYNISEIDNSEVTAYGFTLKNTIELESIYTINKTASEFTFEYKINTLKESDIQDILNCADYILLASKDYNKFEDNSEYSYFRDDIEKALNQAIENVGTKVEMNLDDENIQEAFVISDGMRIDLYIKVYCKF